MPDALALLHEANQATLAALADWLPENTEPPARLHAAMRHALLSGGKRLRPALVLAACRTCGGQAAAASAALVAVECLHTATLVHDDLPAMDNDDLRRGQPTVHKAFDEYTAILAGDALLVLAFQAAAAVSAEAAACLAQAVGSRGVMGGQQDDLDSERGQVRGDEGLLTRIHRRKTGALLGCACELGALIAGAPEPARQALRRFGQLLGVAFQLIDDCLDQEASADTLGKTPGKDHAQGKLTGPSLWGLDRTRERARAAQQEALAILDPWRCRAGDLQALADFVCARKH